jgi:hypothetical protein
VTVAAAAAADRAAVVGTVGDIAVAVAAVVGHDTVVEAGAPPQPVSYPSTTPSPL